MENRRGKRATPDDAGYLKLIQIGNISLEQKEYLNPLFNELKQAIHEKWAACPLDDGNTAKTLHFWLASVLKLEEILDKRVMAGKKASHRLEELNDGR